MSKEVIEIPVEIEMLIQQNADHYCLHEGERMAYRAGQKAMYRMMKKKMDEAILLTKWSSPELEKHDTLVEDMWVRLIEIWQPGKNNTRLGSAIEKRFDKLLKNYVGTKKEEASNKADGTKTDFDEITYGGDKH